MRNMSFSLTTQQLLDGSKTVTRRKGWIGLKAGDRVRAVKKAMGLKPGEKIEQLAEIEIVSVRREALQLIDQADVNREGFPDMDPAAFVAMFCKHMGGDADQLVTRIEFRHVQAAAKAA